MSKPKKDALDRLADYRKACGVSTLMDRGELVAMQFMCSNINDLYAEIARLQSEIAELKGALKCKR